MTEKAGFVSPLVVIAVFTLFFWLGIQAADYVSPGKPSGYLEGDKIILLIGVDARHPDEPSRSDTIMVAFLHPDLNRVDLLSIPRDTRVVIAGEAGKRKINHAHAQGGPKLLAETLEKEFGIYPDWYVEVNFAGFERAIDLMGGVEINVEKRMYNPYEGIDLKPGYQRLNGHDALAYVRYRGDGLGDIGRIERQQKFLRALANQAMARGIRFLSPQVAKELRANLKTDLTVKELITMLDCLRAVKVNTYLLPGEPRNINGASYWIADEKATKQLIQKLKRPQKVNSKVTECEEAPHAYSPFGLLRI